MTASSIEGSLRTAAKTSFPKVVNLWWFDVPMALFEIALSVLLVVRGLRAPRLATT